MTTYGRTMAAAVRHFWDNGVQCPCGARPEAPDTHPHVPGCPVGAALERINDDGLLSWDLPVAPGTIADEYAKSYWPPILVDPDGEFDIAQAKAELVDYANLMREVSKVYMDVTGSMISKPHTLADAVIQVHEERCPIAAYAIDDVKEEHALMRSLLAEAADAFDAQNDGNARLGDAAAMAAVIRRLLDEVEPVATT